MFKSVSRKLKKDQRGLTLVELLAVVVILAIVSAIAFVLIGNVIDNSKKDAHISNAQQIISAVKLGEASGDIKLAKGTAGAPTKFEVIKTTGPTIDSLDVIVDPWEKEPYNTVDVFKDDKGLYSITITLKTPPTPEKCKIATGVATVATSATESNLQKGRKSICP